MRPLLPLLFFLFLPVLLSLPPHGSATDQNYTHCGSVNISYPFSLYNSSSDFNIRGYRDLQIYCDGDKATLRIQSHNYTVTAVNYSSYTITVNDAEVGNNSACLRVAHNLTFPPNSSLGYTSNDVNLTFFFDCWVSLEGGTPINCLSSNGTSESSESYSYVYNTSAIEKDVFYYSSHCLTEVVAPVLGANLLALMSNSQAVLASQYGAVLQDGFELVWSQSTDSSCKSCEDAGGQCGFNLTGGAPPSYTCLCPNRPGQESDCGGSTPNTNNDKTGRSKSTSKAVIVGIVVAVSVGLLLLLCLVAYLRRQRQKHSPMSMLLSDSSPGEPHHFRDPESSSVLYDTHVFSYEELEQATNSFDPSRELGDGGFGAVYKGILRDGRTVAIKRMYENNSRQAEQFANEVVIVSQLRHPHLVSLFGCTSRHSRVLLLVYEFVPNGTVADHLHGPRAAERLLPWPRRLAIAVETATALSYLHAIDPPVIHRDVKTSNILLDAGLHVKVADFGLSRLFPFDATHVSTSPQGTPGYVDPEYHQRFQLTDKSDVYSFGVVLVELISSKPAVDLTRHRDEVNLASMAISKIQGCKLQELVDPWLGYETDEATRRMTTMVAELAFRCLQSNGDMRPPMREVLEVLRGIAESGGGLQVEGMNVGMRDYDALPKGSVPPLSPASVMAKWVSSSTTPNTSE